MVTWEEFNLFKDRTNEAFNNITARMTTLINAHDKAIKDLDLARKEISVLKKFHHGHGDDDVEIENKVI